MALPLLPFLANVLLPCCRRFFFLAMAVVVIEQCWADAAMAGGTSAAQVPFLALLQGAMGDGGAGMKREYGAFHCRQAASDADLLESCVTQAVAAPPVVETPAGTTRAGAERRKKRPRARPRATPPPEKRKKPEEAECQRMTHIAVERNRRRLMNDHLASLRALIPSDYIPRVSDMQSCIATTNHCCKKFTKIFCVLAMFIHTMHLFCRVTKRRW
jgi:hypothetical protein